ncbi:MAG: hypothetical protein SFY68_09830 [Candidatus Sumerlaeia bacterium]|nr:hypothetical protein [Candidatus Sumerlaeia bacterium]
MRFFLLPPLLLAFVASYPATLPAQQASFSSSLQTEWAAHSLWNDGNAEVAEYEGTRLIYGKPRPHTHHLITVKEDFLTNEMVKADWPYDGKSVFPVIKQNAVATVETENYPYHYMSSVFLPVEKPTSGAIKLTTTCHEWCGITTREFIRPNGAAGTTRQNWMSYWEGQGTGKSSPEFPEGTVFMEELPLFVRMLQHRDSLTFPLNVVESQTTSKTKSQPQTTSYTLLVQDPLNVLPVPYGTYNAEEYWTITLRGQERTLTFHVERTFPHHLLAYSLGDGREYKLKSLERWDYWNFAP